MLKYPVLIYFCTMHFLVKKTCVRGGWHKRGRKEWC